jgi:exosortase/archaeosortase family protein
MAAGAGAAREGEGQAAGDGKPRRRRRVRRPPPSKKPIFQFVAGLIVLLIIANVALRHKSVDEKLIPQYLRGWANVSAAVLNVFGENAKVYGSAISSPRFSVNIKKGCDAVQPTVLFICAVLASPVARWSKLPGLALGILFLMIMNLVRVLSLFYIGIYWNSAFEIMHHDVWQAAFIILSILAWAAWALWAVRKTTEASHATTG